MLDYYWNIMIRLALFIFERAILACVFKYIAELKDNYEHISSSTDFEFYTDDDAKVFAKDLKTYNGTTLQYIGIMPTTKTLSYYIKNTNAEK